MYEELIQELRCERLCRRDCPMSFIKVVGFNKWEEGCRAKDAAAAIEALEAEVKDAFNRGYNAGYVAGVESCTSKLKKRIGRGEAGGAECFMNW